jgi:hypothetical protein
MFDLQGRFITDFQLLDMTDVAPIQEVHFWGNGAAAITSGTVIKVVEVNVYYRFGGNLLFIEFVLCSLLAGFVCK